VTKETSIEQTVSEIKVQRKGAIVIKKDSFIFGIFTECDLFTQSLYTGRNLTVTHVLSLCSDFSS
jgi:predicted transcriptional regulator